VSEAIVHVLERFLVGARTVEILFGFGELGSMDRLYPRRNKHTGRCCGLVLIVVWLLVPAVVSAAQQLQQPPFRIVSPITGIQQQGRVSVDRTTRLSRHHLHVRLDESKETAQTINKQSSRVTLESSWRLRLLATGGLLLLFAIVNGSNSSLIRNKLVSASVCVLGSFDTTRVVTNIRNTVLNKVSAASTHLIQYARTTLVPVFKKTLQAWAAAHLWNACWKGLHHATKRVWKQDSSWWLRVQAYRHPEVERLLKKMAQVVFHQHVASWIGRVKLMVQ
jgi:hypothetical protein